ncbi:site-specific DNA-methyltransferase [bacterium]|nr:MAG: site-specific DNA-methyltransferase [bacterium]
MKNNGDRLHRLLGETREKIEAALTREGVVILPPMDVHLSARLLVLLGIKAQTTIFDPWYNKGFGGERDDYIAYIVSVLRSLEPFSEHLFFWGFPEIIAHFVDKIPEPLAVRCWVTWFYKNSPSMIRGWRSAQMTCLHLSRPDAKMHVENFLNEVQLQKLKQGKLRFIPGPPSVIEEPLLCGFVGKNEQTGHPSQKPIAVIERLVLMGTARGELVVDLMSGAGTSAVAAYNNERFSIICDVSEEYTSIAEKRLGIHRIDLPRLLTRSIDEGARALRIKKFKMPFKNGRLADETVSSENQQLTLAMK